MGNPMNVNAKNWMVQCLHQLASTEFQERVWVRGEGPEISFYDELVCQLFDDTGLGALLESENASAVLGDEATGSLLRLSHLLDQIPPGIGAEALLQLPIWREIVEVAGEAADLVTAPPTG